MNSDQQHITRLLQKSLDGSLSQAELYELIMLAKDREKDEAFDLCMLDQLAAFRVKDGQEISFWQNQLAEIPAKITAGVKSAGNDLPVHRVRFFQTTWFRYAAILLLIAGTATYLYTSTSSFRRNPGVTKTHEAPKPQDILPGSNKAILTLAGGEQIQLDSSANAYLAGKGIANTNSALRYSDAPALAESNTLTTPRGGQYKVQLSDGTNVWLNAASSITYPTAFTGNNRTVSVMGEAYFEVAADKSKPFVVNTRTDIIHVLGTGFNVHAYADEPEVKTSLVDGRIKVGSTVLQPGQAYINGKAVTTDVQQDVAWKQGVFNFQNKKLEDVMREIARWYDMQVVYPDKVPNITLVGKISRNMQLPDMLKTLEQLEVHYSIKERTITILP